MRDSFLDELFTPMRIGIEKGKAVMKPMKKRKRNDPHCQPIEINITHNHHYKEKFEDIYTFTGKFSHRVPIIGDFDFGECGSCGKRWYEEYQEICEGCGVDLSRM